MFNVKAEEETFRALGQGPLDGKGWSFFDTEAQAAVMLENKEKD